MNTVVSTNAKHWHAMTFLIPFLRSQFIPIAWYDKVRSPNHSLVTSLTAVTLSSIPSLRAIANDVIFDVLMYLTPEYCEAILQCVTTQIIELYR